jgi:hypothetical protein
MSKPKIDPADERTPYEIARDKLEQNRKAAMRSARLRSKPLSTMPATSTGTHGLYTQLASLQMSKARQEKIREALLEQVARCEDEIARVDIETQRLKERIDAIDAATESPRKVARTAPKAASHSADDSSVESLEEAFRFKY